MHILLNVLLFLWIFFIPASLALRWNETAGFVNGILVDYRIPTLAASAVFFLLFSSLFIFALIRKEISLPKLKKTLIISLSISLIFQISVSLYQTVFQRSLTGYLPFGEVNLSIPQTAKGITARGTIYTLPYGTTSHPNVLAGFCVMSFLIILTHTLGKTPSRKEKLSLIILFVAVTAILIMSQSISALLALFLALFFFICSLGNQEKCLKGIIMAIPVLVLVFLSKQESLHPSFQRRAKLQQIATKMIIDRPLWGIGWNNFTLFLENYGYVEGTTRFLQPPHNVFLLLVTELGLIGWAVNFSLIFMLWRLDQKYLPLAVALVTVASLDHYLLTLTTGRMLFILFLFYVLIREYRTIEVLAPNGQ